MKNFILITKANCAHCRRVKDWIHQYDLKYEEWALEAEEVQKILCKDQKILDKYEKNGKCEVPAPLIYMIDEKEYYYNQIFGLDGIREHFLKKLFDIESMIPVYTNVATISEKLYCTNDLVQKFLEKYILALSICKTSGTLLYSFRVDPSVKMELITQFIAALSMFGEENLGYIERVFIKGLDIEMSFITKHDLIFTVLFHSGMVTDYLNEEAVDAIDRFYELFQKNLDNDRTNIRLYEGFDHEMCIFIQKFLVRIGVLECIDCSMEIPILKESKNTENVENKKEE